MSDITLPQLGESVTEGTVTAPALEISKQTAHMTAHIFSSVIGLAP